MCRNFTCDFSWLKKFYTIKIPQQVRYIKEIYTLMWIDLGPAYWCQWNMKVKNIPSKFMELDVFHNWQRKRNFKGLTIRNWAETFYVIFWQVKVYKYTVEEFEEGSDYSLQSPQKMSEEIAAHQFRYTPRGWKWLEYVFFFLLGAWPIFRSKNWF